MMVMLADSVDYGYIDNNSVITVRLMMGRETAASYHYQHTVSFISLIKALASCIVTCQYTILLGRFDPIQLLTAQKRGCRLYTCRENKQMDDYTR